VGKQTALITNLLSTRLDVRPLSGKGRVCVQRTVGGTRSRYGRDFLTASFPVQRTCFYFYFLVNERESLATKIVELDADWVRNFRDVLAFLEITATQSTRQETRAAK
jgi:hypothetical protein